MINYRGMALQMTPGTKPMFLGDLSSFKEPLREILSKASESRKIYLVGFSLGGTIAVNLLSEDEFDDGSIDGAVAVNPAFDVV